MPKSSTICLLCQTGETQSLQLGGKTDPLLQEGRINRPIRGILEGLRNPEILTREIPGMIDHLSVQMKEEDLTEVETLARRTPGHPHRRKPQGRGRVGLILEWMGRVGIGGTGGTHQRSIPERIEAMIVEPTDGIDETTEMVREERTARRTLENRREMVAEMLLAIQEGQEMRGTSEVTHLHHHPLAYAVLIIPAVGSDRPRKTARRE